MPPKTLPKKVQLASKEQTLFKELLQLYETRQLKRAQKTADQILKKAPDHGETTSMKGLVLVHMGKKEEGLELVRKGVRLDLSSHICWHVYGLVHKQDKNYEEALKCYVQALKFDRENMNILRDAAQLQTQLRLVDSLVDTRLLILKLRPNLRQNWISLAVAYHLGGNLSQARVVLEAYLQTVKNVPDYDYEHSELLMYYVRILEDLEEYLEALSVLDINSKSRGIVDRTSILLFRARLLTKLDRKDEAEAGWRILIDQNPDCYDYYSGFLRNKGIDLDAISEEKRPEALQILRNFSEHLPRASAPLRLSLNIAQGDNFEQLVKTYLIKGLSRGIPSLFSDIKALYPDVKKRQIVEDLVEGFLKRLQANSGLETEEAENPDTYLWTLYFLSHHYSLCGDHQRALDLLNVALEHTPSLPDLYMAKARTLKRAGDPYGASAWMEEARKLDGQDRFLNTKSAKYFIQAGDIDTADQLLGMFTKKDAPSPGADLEEMQSLNYILQAGGAHHRAGRLGQALKKFHAIDQIFNDYEDDQFDFHAYSIRKFTINIYIATLGYEDHVRSHDAYITAALSASQIYVKIHDDPAAVAASLSPSGLTDAAKKAKKTAAKKAKKLEEAKKTVASAGDETKADTPAPPKDDDPDGTKLLSTTTPLEQAAKFLRPLQTMTPQLDVWIAVYDVAIRRKKYLQALNALRMAVKLQAEGPEVHLRRIDYHLAVSAAADLPTPVSTIIKSSLDEIIPPPQSPDSFNSAYAQIHSTTGRALWAVAKSARRLNLGTEAVETLALNVVRPEVTTLSVQTALDALALLRDINSQKEEEFRAACQARFPLSTVFQNPTEQAAVRAKVVVNGSADDADREERDS